MGSPRRRDPALTAAAIRRVATSPPNYKVIGILLIPPIVAALWAFASPGFTVGAIVVCAVLDRVDRRRTLPGWPRADIKPAAAGTA